MGCLHEYFGEVDLTGLPEMPRLPDTEFHDRLELRVDALDVELLRLGPAHTAGDCIAHIPDAATVFAGALLVFGDHPVCWGQGPLSGPLRALRQLLKTGARYFVPVTARSPTGMMSPPYRPTWRTPRSAQGMPCTAVFRSPMPRGRVLPHRQPERLASVVQAAYQEAGPDRYGRRRVFVAGSVGLLAWSAAFFPLIDLATMPAMAVAMIVMATALGFTYGPQAALFSELFPAKLRYSGSSLGYQLGAILGGGIAPTVATALYDIDHSSLPVTLYLVLITAFSLGCVLLLTRRRAGLGSEPGPDPVREMSG